jgi:putative membrane protein
VLIPLLAHPGLPPAPHDLWSSWNLDPLLLFGLSVTVWLYARGRQRGSRRTLDRRRAWCFAGAAIALVVALVSPLEALSNALASAHMVQHVLLVLVAAPLLALSAPGGTLLRGAPPVVRRGHTRWRRRLHLRSSTLHRLRHPATAWVLHVAALWIWHSARAYDAALGSTWIHVLEHVSFLASGVLFWHVVIGVRGSGRVPRGLGILLVFGMAMQSVFLSLLLTFAREPWYAGYATTTEAWGLSHVADQHLAGAIMWVPAGVVYVLVALTLLARWIRASEETSPPPVAVRPVP